MSGRSQGCISGVILVVSVVISLIMIGATKYISSVPDATGFQTDSWPKVPNTTHIGHIEILVTDSKRQKRINNSYYWVDDDLIKNGVFTTRFVSDREMAKDTLIANCSEGEFSRKDKCVKKHSLDTILTAYPDTNWFIYYSDPFFMNLTNLNRYLRILDEFYDPKVHLVAKGATLPGYENVDLIHPHSILIKSRAFIEMEISRKITPVDIANKFDVGLDVIEAVVIEEILSARDWMEPFLVNTECKNCDDLSKITECFGFKFLLNMKDVIAWNRGSSATEISHKWMNFDNHTFFYYDKMHQPHACTADGDIIVTSISMKTLTHERKRMKAGDVSAKKIRSIIDGTCKQCTQMRIR